MFSMVSFSHVNAITMDTTSPGKALLHSSFYLLFTFELASLIWVIIIYSCKAICVCVFKKKKIVNSVPATLLPGDDETHTDEYTAPLLRDIDLLSSLLGEVIKSENECVFEVSKQIHHYLKIFICSCIYPYWQVVQQVQGSRSRTVQRGCWGIGADDSKQWEHLHSECVGCCQVIHHL